MDVPSQGVPDRLHPLEKTAAVIALGWGICCGGSLAFVLLANLRHGDGGWFTRGTDATTWLGFVSSFVGHLNAIVVMVAATATLLRWRSALGLAVTYTTIEVTCHVGYLAWVVCDVVGRDPFRPFWFSYLAAHVAQPCEAVQRLLIPLWFAGVLIWRRRRQDSVDPLRRWTAWLLVVHGTLNFVASFHQPLNAVQARMLWGTWDLSAWWSVYTPALFGIRIAGVLVAVGGVAMLRGHPHGRRLLAWAAWLMSLGILGLTCDIAIRSSGSGPTPWIYYLYVPHSVAWYGSGCVLIWVVLTRMREPDRGTGFHVVRSQDAEPTTRVVGSGTLPVSR